MLSAIILAAMSVAVQPRDVSLDSVKADSLRTLHVILTSELKGGSQVLHMENRALADSLILNLRQRDAFFGRILDRSVSRKMGSKAEFKEYWKEVESEAGFPGLRAELAARDIDKSRIPKRYLFDSSVVVYPGWIVLRRLSR